MEACSNSEKNHSFSPCLSILDGRSQFCTFLLNKVLFPLFIGSIIWSWGRFFSKGIFIKTFKISFSIGCSKVDNHFLVCHLPSWTEKIDSLTTTVPQASEIKILEPRQDSNPWPPKPLDLFSEQWRNSKC